MNKYCEYVFTNEHGSEMCHLSNEVCPKFFKDIASNCCEKRAAVIDGSKTGTSTNKQSTPLCSCGVVATNHYCDVCDNTHIEQGI